MIYFADTMRKMEYSIFYYYFTRTVYCFAYVVRGSYASCEMFLLSGIAKAKNYYYCSGTLIAHL